MTDDEYFRSRLRMLRPTAKFVEIAPPGGFLPAGSEPVVAFHHASLYDERIDLQFVETPRGPVLIDNTYLGSFAYNLLACWLHAHSQPWTPAEREARLATLLRHNFKKFYAEQLLWRANNCFSRAVFLETLLYEQQVMVPVFAARETNASLHARIAGAARLMTGLCASHELGHCLCDRHPEFWEEFMTHQPLAQRAWFAARCQCYPPAFADELKCDWIACHSTLTSSHPDLAREEVLRGIVFGFAAFAVLYSLDKSAAATADSQSQVTDNVDLRDISKRHHAEEFVLGHDRDFIERAQIMRELATLIADNEGIILFTPDSAFPLAPNVLDYLFGVLDTIMDCSDANSRAMSMLVAEALHGHPAGIDYLYLRSKVFSSNRKHLNVYDR